MSANLLKPIHLVQATVLHSSMQEKQAMMGLKVNGALRKEVIVWKFRRASNRLPLILFPSSIILHTGRVY